MNTKNFLYISIGFVGLAIIIVIFYGLVSNRPQPTITDPLIVEPTGVVEIKSITAVDDLTDVVYSDLKKLHYVASFDESKIYVINAVSGNNEGEIPLAYPNKMLMDDTNRLLYVSTGPKTVMELSLDSFQTLREVTVGNRPSRMALTSNRKYLFVVNEYEDTISVIDVATFTVIKTIPVGRRPLDITVNRSGEYVYVVSRDDATVTKISISNLNPVGLISNVGRAVRVLPYPVNDLIMVLDQYSNQIYVIDENTNTIVKSISTVDYPVDFAINETKKEVYVLSFTQNIVGVVSLEQEGVIKQLQLSSAFESSSGANNLRYDSRSNKVLVTNTNTGKIYIISLD